MKEGTGKCLVYMRRPNPFSHALSISECPVKRRRFGEDFSLAPCNLDKTKPVNEFQCTGFDDACIRKTDSFKYFHSVKDFKNGQLEKAIVTDSEFEVQGQNAQLHSSDGDWLSASDSEDSDCDESSQLKGDGSIETELFDVRVMTKASYRAENVPYVCLTSQLNGQAILGYPVEIQVLKIDDYKSSRPKKGNADRKLFFPLVWKTAKRTPVCYISDPISPSVFKNAAQGGGKEKGVLVKEAESRSCVPVELIFSKILGAVSCRI